MNDTIKTILYAWKDRKLPEVIPRDINLSSNLTYGGMSEVVLTAKEHKHELLQQYYRTVVSRDYQAVEERKHRKIQCIPLHLWLLQKPLF